MGDAPAPVQKLDGPAPVAGPSLVDFSGLDFSKTGDKRTASSDAAPSNVQLASLQLTDSSTKTNPTQIADSSQPAAAPGDNRTAAPQANCDTSDVCSFKPEQDSTKPLAKSWWDANSQLAGSAPEKDANCLYTVKFGDALSTIAQRELQSEGKEVNKASIKDEMSKLVKLNDLQYKSLDCNTDYLKAGWRLKLNDECQAPAAPQEAPCPPGQQAPPPEAPCPPGQQAPPPEAPCPPGEQAPRVEAPCPPGQQGAIERTPHHIFQEAGHHLILNYNGCQYKYDVPAGKSVIYDDNGDQRMITALNQDGSRPTNSEILYEIDRHGQRHNLTADQSQGFQTRFAPDFAGQQSSYTSESYRAPQDQYSIQERQANNRQRNHDQALRDQAAQDDAAAKQADATRRAQAAQVQPEYTEQQPAQVQQPASLPTTGRASYNEVAPIVKPSEVTQQVVPSQAQTAQVEATPAPAPPKAAAAGDQSTSDASYVP